MSAQSIHPGPISHTAQRDRVLILAGLVGVGTAAWVYLIHLASIMPAGHDMAVTGAPGSSPASTPGLAIMWVIMMIAMMLPSGAPAIWLFARHQSGGMAGPVATFALGYLLPWTAFGVMAGLVQSALHSMALLSPTMQSVSPLLGGGLLIAAGIYQWLPVKARCLARCRSPISEVSTGWPKGTAAALVMGVRHGLVCVECCWLLMLLLFAAGVMNLAWVAAIALLMLLERVVAGGPAIGMLAGSVLAAWGVWVVVGT